MTVLFSAHRCKAGAEASAARAKNARDETEREFWLRREKVWLTRWRQSP